MSNDAVHNLPSLTWLGSKVYADDIETSWTHRNPERAFPYVDGEAHENTGRKSLKVSATLLFLNTIEPGLFPGKWRNFRGLLLGGQSGILRHPDIGNFHARVENSSYRITSKSTSGVRVQAAWTESIKSADEPTKIVTGKADAAATARKADAAMAELGLDYPDGMGEGTTLEGLINEFFSIGALFTQQIFGEINRIIGLTDQIYVSMQVLGQSVQYADAALRAAIAGHPSRWILETALKSLRVQLKDTLDAATQGARPIKSYTNPSDASLATISLAVGAIISDLVDLNPSVLGSPIVPKGTKILYHGDG